MLRGFAAIYVFAGHMLFERGLSKSGGVGFLFRFGQEAVMLFFIISGFVIFHSTHHHANKSFRSYFLRRLKRIYPIFLFALLVSYLSVRLTGSIPADWRIGSGFLGNVMMFQDFGTGKPGVVVDPFCGNLPLWSLSYEWWFYMMFYPIYSYVSPRFQQTLVFVLSLIGVVSYWCFPNQVSLFLMYFILWWSGVEVARTMAQGHPASIRTQSRTISALLIISTLVAGMAVSYVRHGGALSFGIHPILELRHFLSCLLLLCGGLWWAGKSWRGFETVFRHFAVFAPISYGVYVLHYPLAVRGSYLSGLLSRPWDLLGYIAVTFALAYVAEVPFQRLNNRIFKGASLPRRGDSILRAAEVDSRVEVEGSNPTATPPAREP